MTSPELPQTVDNDRFPMVDPFTAEIFLVDRVADDQIRLLHVVASFKLVRQAKEFAARYLHSGHSFEANVRVDKREVRWDALVWGTETRHQYRLDLLENIAGVGGMSARLGTSFDDPQIGATLAPMYRSY